jgi:hypothetical protein
LVLHIFYGENTQDYHFGKQYIDIGHVEKNES